jgi:hypothetical protein
MIFLLTNNCLGDQIMEDEIRSARAINAGEEISIQDFDGEN